MSKSEWCEFALEPFRAEITETGVKVNRTELTDENLATIEKLKASAKIVERHGQSSIGFSVSQIPFRE